MAAPGSNPRWLDGLLRAEKALAPPVTAVLHSERFADVTRVAATLRQGAGRRAQGIARRVLRLANLPAGSDVTRLLGEVGRLQNQVRALSVQLDEAKVDEAVTARTRSPIAKDQHD